KRASRLSGRSTSADYLDSTRVLRLDGCAAPVDELTQFRLAFAAPRARPADFNGEHICSRSVERNGGPGCADLAEKLSLLIVLPYPNHRGTYQCGKYQGMQTGGDKNLAAREHFEKFMNGSGIGRRQLHVPCEQALYGSSQVVSGKQILWLSCNERHTAFRFAQVGNDRSNSLYVGVIAPAVRGVPIAGVVNRH